MVKSRTAKAFNKLILTFPRGEEFLRKIANYLEKKRLAKIGRNAKEIFHHHFITNEWGNDESVSGAGSTIQYTENIRKKIPKLISELRVTSILDAPCGDYNWFRFINLETDIIYIGADIVEPLIERNNSLYGKGKNKFIVLDITNDALPKVDLWLCRDCLFHLSNHDIALAIRNFLDSDIRYFLTTTHPACNRNYDIPTGTFRFLNLQLPPFNFGQPIHVINDWIEGNPIRYLALWERETLKKRLDIKKML